jgi:hypothetical protein
MGNNLGGRGRWDEHDNQLIPKLPQLRGCQLRSNVQYISLKGDKMIVVAVVGSLAEGSEII